MSIIDVYLPAGLIPINSGRALATLLAKSLLRAEGVVVPSKVHLDNTAVYFHLMDPEDVHTAAAVGPRIVRVQVLTPPSALSRDGQKQMVRDMTDIVDLFSADPEQGVRTWVIHTEAVDGGWGLLGAAFGKEEFATLAAWERDHTLN